jgi:hypothetical protein
MPISADLPALSGPQTSNGTLELTFTVHVAGGLLSLCSPAVACLRHVQDGAVTWCMKFHRRHTTVRSTIPGFRAGFMTLEATQPQPGVPLLHL